MREKVVIKINLFGLCENAYFHGILNILSSISSLNTIHGTKLKLKLRSPIGQIRKCSNCMFITINENNRNERTIAENLRGCTYKITFFSAAYYPLQLILVQN